METKLVVFKDKKIRRTLHNDEWWFSVADVVEALTDSTDPRQYIKRMRQRDPELDANWGTICTPLELVAPDGKSRETDCANTESMFLIIHSIPSPKAEPFKRWLAKVGYERVQEIEDPELATKRTKELYRAKGYSGAWIEKGMRGIAIRAELTDEWRSATQGGAGVRHFDGRDQQGRLRQDAQGFGENRVAVQRVAASPARRWKSC